MSYFKDDRFICPLCKKEFPIKEADIYEVRTSKTLVNTMQSGRVIQNTYECHYHNIRVCKKCSNKQKIIEYGFAVIWLISLIVFFIAFGKNYFNVDHFWTNICGFITPKIEERSILSFVIWCIVFFFLSLMLLGTVIAAASYLLHRPPYDITYEEALKCNAIAPASYKKSHNKGKKI